MSGDDAAMSRCLTAVNYYRLSAYWHTFRNDDHSFRPGTSIDVVWERYIFDRELRLLVMDALERLEVAVRTMLAYEHGGLGGPFGYEQNPAAVYGSDKRKRDKFFRLLKKSMRDNGHERFMKHFKAKYGDEHDWPPIWVMVEVLTFGGVVSLYMGSPKPVRRAVANQFHLADPVFGSWLRTLNAVRNICAHHGRLWNRELGAKPKLPRGAAWREPVRIDNDRVFVILSMLAHAMHLLAPGSQWSLRVAALLKKYPHVPRSQMGIPDRWMESPVWVRAVGAAE